MFKIEVKLWRVLVGTLTFSPILSAGTEECEPRKEGVGLVRGGGVGGGGN